MKLTLLALTLMTSAAHAQWVPVPIPDYCTDARVQKVLPLVKAVCEEKVSAFVQEKRVDCEIESAALYGCRAACESEGELFAKLRLDVNTDCLRQTARLRKTVIKYY